LRRIFDLTLHGDRSAVIHMEVENSGCVTFLGAQRLRGSPVWPVWHPDIVDPDFQSHWLGVRRSG
jgi:hypothetical protein